MASCYLGSIGWKNTTSAENGPTQVLGFGVTRTPVSEWGRGRLGRNMLDGPVEMDGCHEPR